MEGNSVFVLDHDLASSPMEFATAQSIVPGATPGLVWLMGTGTEANGGGLDGASLMDLASGTAGDRVEVGERTILAVADGFIVEQNDPEADDGLIVESDGPEGLGRFAYWSAKSGLVSLDLPDPGRTMFEAASGDLVVAISSDVVRVLNVVSGSIEADFPIDFTEGTVRSSCVSPDQTRVVVVWSNGRAFVGDIVSGEITTLPSAAVSTGHGIRTAVWASAEQLVYVIDRGNEIAVEALDITSGRRSSIANLEGSINWLLAADAAMC
jgi:hypothetical protein